MSGCVCVFVYVSIYEEITEENKSRILKPQNVPMI
jgi:hypothetical protein